MIYSCLQWKAPQRYQRHLLKDVETQCLFQTVQFLDFSDFSAVSSFVTARALPRYARRYPCAVHVHIFYPVELWGLLKDVKTQRLFQTVQFLDLSDFLSYRTIANLARILQELPNIPNMIYNQWKSWRWCFKAWSGQSFFDFASYFSLPRCSY